MEIMKIKRILVLFTMIAIMLSGLSSLNYSHSAPQAAVACNGMGSNFNRESIDKKNLVKPASSNRKWTVQEVFDKSTVFSTYYGEGEGTWMYAAKVDRGKDRVGQAAWTATGVQDKLKAARSGICFSGDNFPNLGLLFAGGVVKLINGTVSSLIGSDNMTEGLSEVIGGKSDSDTGLIGTFVNSIYMPLVVIAFLFSAVTIIYKGLIKMQLREALMASLWSIGSFVIGLTLMLNPSMLVGFPQQATTTISSCVMGAVTGQNCLSDSVVAPALVAGNECRSEVVGGKNGIDTIVNSMNCTIWKAFVLEPWAEQQFGQPYSDLYTDKIPAGGTKWSSLPKGAEKKYCVNIASKKSAKDSAKTYVNMDLNSNSTICNVALYQLYLKTEMTDNINHKDDGYKLITVGENPEKFDARWYDIIVPMSGNAASWKNWTGQGRLLPRIGTGFISLVSVLLASVILISLSIFGAAYKVISVVAMAFAPVAFLFAIEPNRGRKIFLGWLETVVSAILKYFAITLLMVISLILYAGVLMNTTGLGSLISVIVLTVALWMYRKEIVDLIGASNMGGQRLSNKANELLDKSKKTAKEKGGALVGGAIGGSMAANSNRRENLTNRNKNLDYLRENLKNATPEQKSGIEAQIANENKAIEEIGSKLKASVQGAGKGGIDSTKRTMKRGTSAASMAFKQYDMSKRDLEKEQRDAEKAAAARLTKSEQSQQNNSNGGYSGPPIGPGPKNPNGSSKSEEEMLGDNRVEGLKFHREKVSYNGNLSKEEVSALDNFADKLASTDNDEELLSLAENKDVMADENKRNLVANEINARIRLNSENGQPSGDLSRLGLANVKNISDEELKLNMEIYRENYLETGSEPDFDKFNSYSKEMLSRGGTSIAVEKSINDTRMTRAINEETGKEYKRAEGVPTLEEVKEDPSKHIKDVTSPKNLEKYSKENLDKKDSVDENSSDKQVDLTRRKDPEDPKDPKDPNDPPKGPSGKKSDSNEKTIDQPREMDPNNYRRNAQGTVDNPTGQPSEQNANSENKNTRNALDRSSADRDLAEEMNRKQSENVAGNKSQENSNSTKPEHQENSNRDAQNSLERSSVERELRRDAQQKGNKSSSQQETENSQNRESSNQQRNENGVPNPSQKQNQEAKGNPQKGLERAALDRALNNDRNKEQRENKSPQSTNNSQNGLERAATERTLNNDRNKEQRENKSPQSTNNSQNQQNSNQQRNENAVPNPAQNQETKNNSQNGLERAATERTLNNDRNKEQRENKSPQSTNNSQNQQNSNQQRNNNNVPNPSQKQNQETKNNPQKGLERAETERTLSNDRNKEQRENKSPQSTNNSQNQQNSNQQRNENNVPNPSQKQNQETKNNSQKGLERAATERTLSNDRNKEQRENKSPQSTNNSQNQQNSNQQRNENNVSNPSQKQNQEAENNSRKGLERAAAERKLDRDRKKQEKRTKKFQSKREENVRNESTQTPDRDIYPEGVENNKNYKQERSNEKGNVDNKQSENRANNVDISKQDDSSSRNTDFKLPPLD